MINTDYTSPGPRPSDCATIERRASTRFTANAPGLITNITSGVKHETGLLLDISSTGVRIRTTLAAIPGDSLRIDLPEMTILAEVVYCQGTPAGIEMGLKLFHSLDRRDVSRCIDRNIGE